MYAQAAIKPNALLRNGAYGIVMRGVPKCTRECSSLRGSNSAPLCCIKLDTATAVACGTGVLFPDYISRKAVVTGIDISSEMVKMAKEKFPQIEVICGDTESFSTDENFDVIMLYNAFPHFPNPEKLIENLAKLLKNGGRISIAHGSSREEIHKCHSGKPRKISLPLPEAKELKNQLSPLFNVDIVIYDDEMYLVSGIKK